MHGFDLHVVTASSVLALQAVLLQASNSGKQHYLRAVFSKAGSYALGVTVTDPVTSEAVTIPAHSASQQLIILPGALAAERTQISEPPATLTAGDCSGRETCSQTISVALPFGKHCFHETGTTPSVIKMRPQL